MLPRSKGKERSERDITVLRGVRGGAKKRLEQREVRICKANEFTKGFSMQSCPKEIATGAGPEHNPSDETMKSSEQRHALRAFSPSLVQCVSTSS